MNSPQRKDPRAIALIAAMDLNRGIGRGNALPWHLPDDLKRFKALTTGKTVVMGRKTFESIGRPLPKRRNAVLTRDPQWRAEGVEVAHTLEDALNLEGDLMVIGGGEVYSLFLPYATHLNLTFVDTVVSEPDAFFPPFEREGWLESHRTVHPADERHAFSFAWIDFIRKAQGHS